MVNTITSLEKVATDGFMSLGGTQNVYSVKADFSERTSSVPWTVTIVVRSWVEEIVEVGDIEAKQACPPLAKGPQTGRDCGQQFAGRGFSFEQVGLVASRQDGRPVQVMLAGQQPGIESVIVQVVD